MKIPSLALLALAVAAHAQTSKPAPNPTAHGQTPSPVNTTSTGAVANSADATFSNEELGLSFVHPKAWTEKKVVIKSMVKPQLLDPKTWRPARSDSTIRFVMPLSETKEKGTLDIYAAQFFAEPDIWQSSQRDINSQLKRTVLRQWEEELLGVPLLMTKIQYNDKGTPYITETGLMYSQTPRKLVFRITATPENFDKADAAFRQAMLTLRTTNGKLPSTEDPTRPITVRDINAPKTTIWAAPAVPAIPVEKGSVLTETTAAGKKLNIRTPTGWKVEKNLDGTFSLTSTLLNGSAKLLVASVVDSDPPGKALIRSSGISLDKFSKVNVRVEKGPFLSRSQSQVVTIFRSGVSGVTPQFSYNAAGTLGDFYWILSWSGSDPAGGAKDRQALDALTQIVSVEPIP